MKNSDVNQIHIQIAEGNEAPRYQPTTKELVINTAVITKEGMESGMPLVDFQMTDAEGKEYFTALSARVLCALAEVVKGVIEMQEINKRGKRH